MTHSDESDSVPRADYEAMVAARDLCKRQTAEVERRRQEAERHRAEFHAANAELARTANDLREEVGRLMDELNTARLRLYKIGEIAAEERADEQARLEQAS